MNNHENSRTTVHNRESIVRCVINESVRPADVVRDLDMSVCTIQKWLRRHSMGQLKQFDPKDPVRRYERAVPSDLLHLETRKTGQI